MNGEKHNGEQHNGAEDPWAPVTVTADQPAPHDQQAAYQRQLTAAGYGEEQRVRYIEESGEDPEYAACVWDEQIVAGAEAAGIIPENPRSLSPAEEATHAARDAAISEFWTQHPEYDVFSNSPENQALFRQAMEHGDQKAREALGERVAEHLLSRPQEPERADDEEIDL
ncbi:hypothetical protein [Streptomyces sennicomposti]|uniref:hypothetical protein n=1 Tax=Streptomyces sennicomposti TaxID=2873384 RepID=UPI001CA6AB66|nr:hypothetical protein [Streptomyces sennicomposti]MBY8868728.1 hypothetical protein [Streptomyces sennicomposti]